MQIEVAQRLVASNDEGVGLQRVRAILDEFLRTVALCPVCGDEGSITLTTPLTIPGSAIDGGGQAAKVLPGTVISCPHCGGPNDEAKPRGDPDYISWHCRSGWTEGDCHSARKGGDRIRAEDHAECNYRVMLPLPDADA